jgi:hypothetical protein
MRDLLDTVRFMLTDRVCLLAFLLIGIVGGAAGVAIQKLSGIS